MNSCVNCNSVDLEIIKEDHIVCKNCGFGFGNKGETEQGMIEHLRWIKDSIKLAMVLFPDLTKKQIVSKVSFHIHNVQQHPTTKDGYCEYCECNWKDLDEKDFAEKTGGLTKKRWIK